MKSFEDACLATFVKKVGSGSEPEVRAAVQEVQAESGRWRGLVEEVHASKLVALYVDAMMRNLEAGTFDLPSLIVSAFCSGLVIGVEMERADPPIPAESVPGRREREYTGL